AHTKAPIPLHYLPVCKDRLSAGHTQSRSSSTALCCNSFCLKVLLRSAQASGQPVLLLIPQFHPEPEVPPRLLLSLLLSPAETPARFLFVRRRLQRQKEKGP